MTTKVAKTGVARTLEELFNSINDRLRRLELNQARVSTNTTATLTSVTIGNYTISQVGPNLVATSNVAPFTVTTIAVP